MITSLVFFIKIDSMIFLIRVPAAKDLFIHVLQYTCHERSLRDSVELSTIKDYCQKGICQGGGIFQKKFKTLG